MTKPHIKIRMLKNVRIAPLGGFTPEIKVTMKHVVTERGSVVLPEFDMSEVFEVPIHDETVYEIAKPANMPERRYEDIVNAAYKNAQENSEKNVLIREDLQHYVKVGQIEIVDDPFGLLYVEDAAPNGKATPITSTTSGNQI